MIKKGAKIMRVTIADLRHESSFTVSDVVRIESSFIKSRGRLSRVWFLVMADGRKKSFRQKEYMLYSVEGGTDR